MNKKITALSLSAAMVIQIATPLASFAQMRPVNTMIQPRMPIRATSTTSTAARVNFCNTIKNFGNKLDERVAGVEAKQSEAKVNALQKATEREQKLAEVRTKADNGRSERYGKLNEVAQNDEQRQAISVFQTAIETAVANRKAAVDAALAAYRSGLSSAIESRKVAQEKAVATFEAAVKAAVAKAVKDCESGVAPQTVRAQLTASIEAARKKMQTDRESLPVIGELVKPLIEARKTATDKAFADFKVAADAARDALKVALSALIPAPSGPTTTPPGQTTTTP